MVDRSAEHWYPTAAYLYVLHLDGLALAWEYLRRYLHQKSGSTAKPYDFACDLRALVARQSLPGYVLGIERMPDNGMELLTFRPVPQTARG